MYLSVLLPSILALFALYKKKLTLPGIIAAWIMGIIITYCGGISAFIALTATFVLTILSDKLKKVQDDKQRNIYQIFSNVLTASICTILYYIKKADLFLVMYYAVINSSLADTLASSIGSLSKETPRHPLIFRKMKKGESGAVSLLGISASILSGFIIGGIYYFISGNIVNYLIIILMGMIGAYFDSLLGAYVQAKYKCKVCRKQVEEPIHHDKECKLVKGYRFMDNNTVNLLNNVLVFIITYLLLK